MLVKGFTMGILSDDWTRVNAPGYVPISAGLLSLEAEVAAEPTALLEAQRALLDGIPPALRPLAGPRLRLVADEIRRRELAVAS